MCSDSFKGYFEENICFGQIASEQFFMRIMADVHNSDDCHLGKKKNLFTTICLILHPKSSSSAQS